MSSANSNNMDLTSKELFSQLGDLLKEDKAKIKAKKGKDAEAIAEWEQFSYQLNDLLKEDKAKTKVVKKEKKKEVEESTELFSQLGDLLKEDKAKTKSEKEALAEWEQLIQLKSEPPIEEPVEEIHEEVEEKIEPQLLVLDEEQEPQPEEEEDPQQSVVELLSKVAKEENIEEASSDSVSKRLDKLEKQLSIQSIKHFNDLNVSGGGLDPNKISAHLIPTTANTYDLGSTDRPWRDVHLSGSTLVIGGTELESSELTVLDGVTTGTVSASKAVIVDANKDITGFRNVNAVAYSMNGTAITATAAELNLLDVSTASGASSSTFLRGDGSWAAAGGTKHIIQKNDLEDGSDSTTSLAAKTNLLFDDNTFRVTNDSGTDSTQVRLESEFTGVTNGTALANRVVILGGSRAIDNIGAMTAVTSFSGGAITSSGLITGNKINATATGAESIQTAGGITMSGAIAGLTGSLTGLTAVTGSGTITGNKLVSTGTGAASVQTGGGITLSGAITGATTINAGDIDVQDTNSEAIIQLHRNETGSNGNAVGKVKFKGQNAAGEETNFAQIGGKQKTITDGSEDGQIEFNVMNAGTLQTSVAIDEDGLVIKSGRKLTFGSTAVDASASEINLLDGDTSASTPTLVDADQIIVNDGPGTMKQVALSRLMTYMEGLTGTGALNSGSITSGFGSIDTGSSTITTTGLISGGSLDIDNVLINGTTIGHTDDTDLITLADGIMTIAGDGKLSGDVYVDAIRRYSDSSTTTKILLNDEVMKFNVGHASNETLKLQNGVATVTGDLTLSGNLTVQGTQTTIETSVLITQDKNITLANVATPTDTTADGGGLTLLGATNKTFNWVDSTDSWTSSEHLDLASGKSFKINGTTVLNATTLQYLDASSSIQTQLNAKQATISSSARLDASLLHDGSISNTEFGYLNGVSSAIQTQMDTKASTGKAIAMAIVFGG